MLCLGVAVVAGDSAVVVVLVCVAFWHRTQTQEKFGTDRKKGIWTV